MDFSEINFEAFCIALSISDEHRDAVEGSL